MCNVVNDMSDDQSCFLRLRWCGAVAVVRGGCCCWLGLGQLGTFCFFLWVVNGEMEGQNEVKDEELRPALSVRTRISKIYLSI